MAEHPLHKAVGDLLKEFANNNHLEQPRLDEACGGKQRISLFKGKKSNENNLCDVDAILLKDKEISVVIEIEESKDDPTTIFGKYLTTAMSNCHIRGKEEIKIAKKSVRFIQIIDTKKLKQKTEMIKKYHLIEKEINENLYGSVKSYKIICADGIKIKAKENNEFKKFEKELTNALKGV
jgi:hypothetical protein